VRTPPLAGVLALESTRAAARRSARTVARRDVSLAPGVAVLALDASVVPAIQAVERYLFEVGLMPQVALCDDAPRLPPLPPLAGRDDHFILQPAGTDVSLSPIDAGLHAVLAAFERPVPRANAASILTSRANVPASRASELLESLLLEGLLTEGPPRDGVTLV
jgi:hypothetical protein